MFIWFAIETKWKLLKRHTTNISRNSICFSIEQLSTNLWKSIDRMSICVSGEFVLPLGGSIPRQSCAKFKKTMKQGFFGRRRCEIAQYSKKWSESHMKMTKTVTFVRIVLCVSVATSKSGFFVCVEKKNRWMPWARIFAHKFCMMIRRLMISHDMCERSCIESEISRRNMTQPNTADEEKGKHRNMCCRSSFHSPIKTKKCVAVDDFLCKFCHFSTFVR